MNLTSYFISFFCLVLFTSCGAFKPANPGTRTTTSRPPRKPRVAVDATSWIRTDITQHAQDLLGIAYKYGGNRPHEGFDCSGLVRYLYQGAGLDLARRSRDQAKEGKLVNAKSARPGDLVFYKRPGGAVFHVSVVVEASPGELWVVHATSSRGVMRENVLASSYWKPKMYQIRNVLQ
ncbi:C40 family peptidase [Neolewinella antarctica]|uniref:Cell wall-associated NlpC family hydrolase n=1 Tax=Neolewinella antarctica TaxID=442734 RepID=A0ABX0XFV7_9BACT|nr:C40 family peptidase [Neolewinella antarctica]NJC28210.1 cell wall-associated NlpC family hydrolase [Neolewinella antarctica]